VKGRTDERQCGVRGVVFRDIDIYWNCSSHFYRGHHRSPL